MPHIKKSFARAQKYARTLDMWHVQMNNPKRKAHVDLKAVFVRMQILEDVASIARQMLPAVSCTMHDCLSCALKARLDQLK